MSDVGWLVIAAAIVVVVSAVGCHSYRRRRELVLTAAQLEFAVVDSLAGRQFTPFCAALLRVLGYRKVRRFRRQRGKAGDLIGQAPDGTLVVIGCARQRDPVEGDAVTALRAAVTSGPQAGRTGSATWPAAGPSPPGSSRT